MKKYKVLSTFHHFFKGREWVTWQEGDFITEDDVNAICKNGQARVKMAHVDLVNERNPILITRGPFKKKEIESIELEKYQKLGWIENSISNTIKPKEILIDSEDIMLTEKFLTDHNGIGVKTAQEILKVAKSISELKKAINENKFKFNNTIMVILKRIVK